MQNSHDSTFRRFTLTDLVYSGEGTGSAKMTKKRSQGRDLRAQTKATVRESISFRPNSYEVFEGIATGKKVSLAWVVRHAAELYVADETKDGGRGRHGDRTTPAP